LHRRSCAVWCKSPPCVQVASHPPPPIDIRLSAHPPQDGAQDVDSLLIQTLRDDFDAARARMVGAPDDFEAALTQRFHRLKFETTLTCSPAQGPPTTLAWRSRSRSETGGRLLLWGTTAALSSRVSTSNSSNDLFFRWCRLRSWRQRFFKIGKGGDRVRRCCCDFNPRPSPATSSRHFRRLWRRPYGRCDGWREGGGLL
jgi:hypothetical protein